ncbi:MAG: FHA domain-containing protein [Microbacterium arborescens]
MFRYPTPDAPHRAGFAMVTDRFALLLGPEAGDDLAAAVWEAMSPADAAFEDVLSVIAAVGIGNLPDFALVELVDTASSSVSVAVRGTTTIDLHGSRRSSYAGAGVGTWVEGSAQHVAGITLTLPAPAPGRPLPLGRGIARADALEWGTTATIPPAQETAGVAEAVSEAVTAAVTELDDSTVLGSRRLPAGTPSTDPPPPRRYLLHVATVGDVPLDQPVVLGRSPRPGRHPGARIVAVPSPRKEVSGTHVELRLDGDRLRVRDLGSTNGTIVRGASGDDVLVRGESDAHVSPGTVLDLGDGVTVAFATIP